MKLANGYRGNPHSMMNRHLQNTTRIGYGGFDYVPILVIKLPNLKVLRIVSHSLFLGMVVLWMSYYGLSMFKEPAGSYLDAFDYNLNHARIHLESLDSVLEHFVSWGFIIKGHRILVVKSGDDDGPIDGLKFMCSHDIDVKIESDSSLESFSHDSFDFVLVFGSVHESFVDHVVKIGGIVVVQLNHKLSDSLQKHSNFRFMDVHKHDYTFVMFRKTATSGKALADSSRKRKLCQLALEAKKATLKNLEDVFLEPPRKGLAESDEYLRNFKFLPNLLGDSLEDYPRRIFIDIDYPDMNNNANVMSWFHEHYPTRNKEFEIFNIDLERRVELGNLASAIDVSDWLMENVKEEDYVVMKAEAGVVEDMIRTATICLVDELFLECRVQWQGGRKNGRRAYWECLALYGRLMDEGVAVHQWWK
ncbi:hypothetical protein ACFE04_003312 [Oxalis oulophora]